MVVNIDPQRGLLVKLPFSGMGTVAITDLADTYRPNPLGGYSKNQILRLVNWLSILNCLKDIRSAITFLNTVLMYVSRVSSLLQVFPSWE